MILCVHEDMMGNVIIRICVYLCVSVASSQFASFAATSAPRTCQWCQTIRSAAMTGIDRNTPGSPATSPPARTLASVGG